MSCLSPYHHAHAHMQVVKALYKKKPRIDTSKAERELRMQVSH